MTDWDEASKQAQRELPQGSLEEREERALDIMEGRWPEGAPQPIKTLTLVPSPLTLLPDTRDRRDPEAIGEMILALQGTVGGKATDRADRVMKIQNLPLYDKSESMQTLSTALYRKQLIEESLRGEVSSQRTLQRLFPDSWNDVARTLARREREAHVVHHVNADDERATSTTSERLNVRLCPNHDGHTTHEHRIANEWYRCPGVSFVTRPAIRREEMDERG